MISRQIWIALLFAGLCEAAVAGDMPQDQKQFLQIVERFDHAYVQAENDILRMTQGCSGRGQFARRLEHR